MAVFKPIDQLQTPLVNSEHLLDWIGYALPGERVKYYVGSLANAITEGRDPELKSVAKLVQEAAAGGVVLLTQKRTGPFEFEYFVTKARPEP
jgi:hypothetical protein